jgi:hypothetical protein
MLFQYIKPVPQINCRIMKACLPQLGSAIFTQVARFVYSNYRHMRVLTGKAGEKPQCSI